MIIIIPCITKAAVFNYYLWDHHENHTVLATGCVACNKRFACGLFIFKTDLKPISILIIASAWALYSVWFDNDWMWTFVRQIWREPVWYLVSHRSLLVLWACMKLLHCYVLLEEYRVLAGCDNWWGNHVLAEACVLLLVEN